MKAIKSDDLAKAILEVLGVSHVGVRRVTLDCRAGDVATVQVEHLASPELLLTLRGLVSPEHVLPEAMPPEMFKAASDRRVYDHDEEDGRALNLLGVYAAVREALKPSPLPGGGSKV